MKNKMTLKQDEHRLDSSRTCNRTEMSGITMSGSREKGKTVTVVNLAFLKSLQSLYTTVETNACYYYACNEDLIKGFASQSATTIMKF